MSELERLYDSACREKHRLARLVDHCRRGLYAVKDNDPDSRDKVLVALSHCEDYIKCRPEAEPVKNRFIDLLDLPKSASWEYIWEGVRSKCENNR